MTPWLADVRAVLSTTPERGPRLVSTLPIDLLARPPAAGEWSALQYLQHLLDAERLVFPVRLHAFLAGQEFADFDPNEPHAGTASLTSEQLVVAFARARQESLVLFKQVTDAAWDGRNSIPCWVLSRWQRCCTPGPLTI